MNAVASFFALFVVALGYGVIVPLGPALVDRAMGASNAQAISLHTGGLSAAYLLAFALLAPLWGRAVDTSWRRLIAAGGLTGFGLSFAAMGLIPGMVFTYATLATAGACAAAVVPAIQVQISGVEGDLAKARLLAALGAASFAGWFVGPPLASWTLTLGAVGGVGATVLPLLLVAILGVVAAVLMFQAIPVASLGPDKEPSDGDRPSFGRHAWKFGLLAMVVTFGIGAFEVSLVLWVFQVLRLEAGFVSRILVECAVVMMIVQAIMFFLPAARPRWNPVAAGVAFAAMAAAIAATPLASGAGALFAVVAIVAAATTLLQAMLSFGTVTSAGRHTGAALGLQLSLSSAGQALGSLGAGAAFSPSGSGFYASAALLAAAALWTASGRSSALPER